MIDIKLNDLLQQINRLNDMIAFHRQHSGDESMITQYEEMRTGFIKKLNRVLKQYQLEVITSSPRIRSKNSSVGKNEAAISFNKPNGEFDFPASPQNTR